MRNLIEVHQNWRENIRAVIAIDSGLLAIPLIAAVQLLQVPKSDFDVPLTLSVYAFAVSIPLLAGNLLGAVLTYTYSHLLQVSRLLRLMLAVTSRLGRLAASVGITCLFWHFTWKAGALFLVVSVVSLIVTAAYYTALEEATEKAKTEINQHNPSQEEGDDT